MLLGHPQSWAEGQKERGKRAELLGQDGNKQVRKAQKDGSRRMDARPGCLPASPLCTQGLPAPMCALRLLAAFLPRVSTPLWPISSIFITFCNAESHVPNLKSALFPNVFVISIPGPSSRALPNAELRLVGAARSLALHSRYLEPSPPSCLLPVLSPGLSSGMPGMQKAPAPSPAASGHTRASAALQAAGQMIHWR